MGRKNRIHYRNVIKDSVQSKMHNRASLALENVNLKKIVNVVTEHMEISIQELQSTSQARQVTLARSMITFFAHYHAKLTLRDIAASFCHAPESLSRTMHNHLQKSNQKEIKKLMGEIEFKLSVSDPQRSRL